MPLTHPFYFSQLEVSKNIYTFHKKPQATSSTMRIRKALLKNIRNNGDPKVTKINTDKKHIALFPNLLPLLHHHHNYSHIYPKANKQGHYSGTGSKIRPAAVLSVPCCGQFRGRPSSRLARPRLRSGACWGFLWWWETLALILDTSDCPPSPPPAAHSRADNPDE